MSGLGTFPLSFGKVEGHIPAQVWMPPPRVGGTYPGVFTWVYKNTYQGVFTVHNAANILQAANGRF
jgi:hypothetical protein